MSITEIVQASFDYSVLNEETRIFLKVATSDIQSRLKRTADDIIAIGEQLIEVKSRLEHGQFVQWLKTEFDMGQATAYNFIHVAEKSRTNPEFTTVVNSKNIGAGRVLYALAEASDNTIAKVASGEIPASADAIQERRRAEKAEEKAKKEEHARLEAERKKEDIESQLSLAQSHSKLAQSKIDELEKQIETIQKPDTVEVTPSELLEQLAKLKADLEDMTRRKDNLSEHCKNLAKELDANRDANEARNKQELYEHEINDRVKNQTSEFGKKCVELLGNLPSPIESQVVTGDSWTRINNAEDMAKRVLDGIAQLKRDAGIIIDALDHNTVDAN